jgi:hypothetical protein
VETTASTRGISTALAAVGTGAVDVVELTPRCGVRGDRRPAFPHACLQEERARARSRQDSVVRERVRWFSAGSSASKPSTVAWSRRSSRVPWPGA